MDEEEQKMNLTELQVQLNQLQSNVERQISQLSAEIEKMKPKKQETEIDYDAITRVAKQYPINGLDICHAPEQMRKEFITMLMYLFVSDDNGLSDRLLYLTRLVAGCKLQMSAKDVYQSALAIEMDDVERLSSELADYRYSFVIEAFVVANLSVEMDKDAWTLLADVAQLMKCDEEEIVVLSHVAKYKLTGDTQHLDEIPLPKTNRWSGKLRDYIPAQWVESKRVNVINISRVGSLMTNYRLGDYWVEISSDNQKFNGKLVNLGENVGSYYELHVSNEDNIRLKFGVTYLDKIYIREKVQCMVTATANGIVYWWEGFIHLSEDKEEKRYCTEAFIVSPFDDYDSFKSWADNR